MVVTAHAYNLLKKLMFIFSEYRNESIYIKALIKILTLNQTLRSTIKIKLSGIYPKL